MRLNIEKIKALEKYNDIKYKITCKNCKQEQEITPKHLKVGCRDYSRICLSCGSIISGKVKELRDAR